MLETMSQHIVGHQDSYIEECYDCNTNLHFSSVKSIKDNRKLRNIEVARQLIFEMDLKN